MTNLKPRFVPLGDSALLVRFGDALDESANQAALGLAARLAAAPPEAVDEVLPNLVSVLLRFDPRRTSADRLAADLRVLPPDVWDSPVEPAASHTIAVTFDGDDLAEVAGLLSLDVATFVARHNASDIRVLATGFAPGFVYCGFHPEPLHVPRRTAVRPAVPAGTVLFAAGQTAIAATAIPTGWHVIGHTAFLNFDPAADPPATLLAGDQITFKTVQSELPSPLRGGVGGEGPSARSEDSPRPPPPAPPLKGEGSERTAGQATVLRIVRAAPLATVQDSGRFGVLRHGVSASGPMDRAAFDSLGGGAAIEFSSGGLALAVEGGACRAAFGGGAFRLTISGRKRKWPTTAALNDGDVVEIATGPAGNYGYVRFDHALDVPLVLGSRATNLVAGLGGLEGRALRPGDVLTLGAPIPLGTADAPAWPDGPIRVVWGLHADLFTPELRAKFLESRFAVTSRMDRMGIRLADPGGVFGNTRALSLVSDAIVPGDIQILGDGAPIVLMRDHQPTGGYPRIATVITADLDRLAQIRPGAEVRFAAVTLDKARAALLSSPP